MQMSVDHHQVLFYYKRRFSYWCYWEINTSQAFHVNWLLLLIVSHQFSLSCNVSIFCMQIAINLATHNVQFFGASTFFLWK